MTVIFLIIFCLIRNVVNDEVNIGAVFEDDQEVEKGFNFAIKNVNQENFNGDFLLVPLVYNNISADNHYLLMQNVCSILEDGVVAIFGPRSLQNIEVVQSICDIKEIPHIITRWASLSTIDKTVINFFPHASSLSKAYFDIIFAKGWKTFTVLYEDNESLLRLRSLIELAHSKGIITQIMQLDPDQSGNYRSTMKTLKMTGQKLMIIDCQIQNLVEVLTQAQQAGIMNENYNYFITNLDAHTENLLPFQYNNANITGIRVINPEQNYVKKLSAELFPQDESFPDASAWKLKTEVALIIDAVNMFAKVISDRQKSSSVRIVMEKKNSLPCSEIGSWEHGLSIVNLLKSYSYEGLTGKILFDNEGYRSTYELTVYELLEGGITDIGTWTYPTGLNISRPQIINLEEDGDSLRNKSFKVLITLTEPYGMMKQTTGHLSGNDMYEGYAIDLIQKLSEMEGFNYTFLVREDKSNGAFDNKTKKWTGMIGDLLEHKADLAICDFTITSDREEAVDFTVPFMSLGISILFKKPENAPPSFFSFADPFGLDTWAMLGLSFFIVSVAFYMMGRVCADEWTNPFPCVDEPEYLVNQFSLNNALWFSTGAILAQGSEIAPIAISSRTLSGIWWYFCLIMNASYTANLAAFLANENPIKLFTDLKSLYENEHGIEYGAKVGGATLRYFTSAEEGTLLKKVGHYMLDHPEVNAKENDEGVSRAENQKYAFFMESSSIEYVTQRHCGLIQYGGLLDEKGYGIAMRKQSTYRKRLSMAILKLQQNHYLDDLKKKWWEDRRGGGACGGLSEGSEADPLGLVNVEGCFLCTIYGTILAVIMVVIEHFFYLLHVHKRSNIAFLQIVKAEFRAYIDFNNASKPNLMIKKSESVEGSQEKEENEASSDRNKKSCSIVSGGEKLKKSKSASKLQSFSRSRSRSRSKIKEKRISRENNRPYGFIIPSSLESLKTSTQ